MRIKNDLYVYAEGGGSGANSADLQSEFRQAFAEFLKKTDLGITRRPRIVPCGGREQAFDSFCMAIAQGQNAILLVDSETAIDSTNQIGATSGWMPWAHLKTQANWTTPGGAQNADCHLMTECMESWFLADWYAVEKFYGNGFRVNALPAGQIEAASKATVYGVLQTATANCKSKAPYGKGAHSFKLLAQISPQKVEAASPWAKRFLDELRKRKP